MKKSLIIGVGITLLMSFNAFAQQWFAANANIDVNIAYAQATVSNSSSYPIYCQGYVYAQAYSGYKGNKWMSGWIQPGMYAQVYVYSGNPQIDPFVDGWADIKCRF